MQLLHAAEQGTTSTATLLSFHRDPFPHTTVAHLLTSSLHYSKSRSMHQRPRQRHRQYYEDDEDLALRIAFEEVRVQDILQGDRALALRLQNEEIREVRNNLARQRARRIATEIPRRVPQSYSPTSLVQIIKRTNIFKASVRLLSRLNIVDPSRSVVDMTASPIIRVRNSMSHRLFRHDCITCMERIEGTAIRAPCGHYYDLECMRGLFDAATKDESLFPPKCCQRIIPLCSVWGHLSPEQRLAYEARNEEYSVQNRVYCARPTCSRFLGPQQDGRSRRTKSRKCPVSGCGTTTCLRCRNRVNPGSSHHCGENNLDQSAITLAKDRGWARCPGCSNMVELSLGCYHMTCRCKAEFCYLCQAQWRTCDCPQFEVRLPVTPPPERRPRAGARSRRAILRVPTPPADAQFIHEEVPLPLAPAVDAELEEISLPLVPTRAVRMDLTRQRHRAFRVLPLPQPSFEHMEEEPYVLVRITSRGPTLTSSATDSDPGTPVAGTDTLGLALKRTSSRASVSSSDISSTELGTPIAGPSTFNRTIQRTSSRVSVPTSYLTSYNEPSAPIAGPSTSNGTMKCTVSRASVSLISSDADTC